MKILGIDPGERSGWAIYDSSKRRVLASGEFDMASFDGVDVSGVEHIVIEDIVPYGPSYPEVVTSAKVGARLSERLASFCEVTDLERRDVKRILTDATLGEVTVKNDATAWAALRMLFQDLRPRKGTALYGIKGHARAALAVAVAFALREAAPLARAEGAKQ